MEYDQLEEECKKTVDFFKRDIARMRTGRASTGLLEGIQVDYYGSKVPINQLGNIAVPEPRMITVQVYDAGAVESVEKAIMSADLGLNPSRDGNLIRINIPALTEERRKELVKKLHKLAEETRVSMRNHRRDAIDLLKKKLKEKEISEDDMHRSQEDIQKITDKYIKEIDRLLQVKEEEIMEV
ncbi:MAG: ribosome recycling factor [Candidatus Dadabacteria bacterium]|nr:MAG: ribosome recycling factor [Candidatus Dadabacteria bacterium]